MRHLYIHTYIHTLLARPHGAFQSQFTIFNLQFTYNEFMKKPTMLWGRKLNLSKFFFCFIQAISEFNAHFRNEAKSGAPGSMQNFSCENEFYLHEDKNALSHQWLCTLAYPEIEAWCNLEMAYYGLLH